MEAQDRLDIEQFTYRAGKDGKVFLYWEGKQIKIIKGKEAEKFLEKIKGASPRDAQLLMARLTGNFKRGNERLAAEHQKRD